LIGVKTGSRVQLDIPAEFAYGDQPRGEVIRAGDALTFVIDVVSVEKPPVVTAPPMADPAECPATDGSEPQQREFTEIQPFCIDVTKTYTALVETNFGEFTIDLRPDKAPQTVNNFVTLARYGYFDETVCHRAIPQYIVQCGDPQADGYGGPGYVIPDELPLPGEYEVGQVAMANGGPNTGGSQFFIFTGEAATQLPPSYALFGDVTAGFDSTVTDIDAVGNPESNGQPPLEEIKILSVTIIES
jgi:cyclophilin family peptidyl-prolyl cis-trans isomerase